MNVLKTKFSEINFFNEFNEIKQQYRQKIANVHPDKGGDAARFIEIREAYEILKQIYLIKLLKMLIITMLS